MAESRVPVTALGALFVATGATALIVEQAFEKLLSTVVGSSTEAGAIVLAVYFLGLSLGGLGYGALRRRFASPLRLYAGLEAVVGVLALGLGVFFAGIQQVSAELVQAAGSSEVLVLAVRLLVAAAWILPPTLAMGATYPAVVGALAVLVRGEAAVQGAMTRIYACNLLGACAAAFAGPYLLFPAFGMTGTLVAAAGLQAVVVTGALTLARRAHGVAAPQAQAGAPLRGLLADRSLRVLLLVSLASGFIVFALEVVWIHLIGATLGMSVYAFAMMLTVVLAGLFCGSTLVGVLGRRAGPHPDWLLPALLAAASAAVLATSAQWDKVPLWLLALGEGVDAFAPGEAVRFRIALLMLGVPSVVLGTIYPSILRSRLFPAAAADRAAGLVAAVNAGGSILGALCTAFWLLPHLGSEKTAYGLGLLPVLLALPLAARMARPRWPLAGVALAAAAAAAAVLTLAPWNRLNLTAGVNVYFRRSFVGVDSRLRSWFEDAAGGITTVVDTPKGGGEFSRTLLTNGKFQGNDDGEVVDQITFGLVPSALTEKRGRALVIGLGTGQSAGVLSAAGFEALDIADISRGIRGAARADFKHINGGVIDDERTHFHLEDGRNYLLRSTDRYDVISMELTSVWFAGASNLYSKEFYALARAKLAPGGILQQWVQLHHAAPAEVMSILATVRSVFPSVSLWMLNSQGCIIAAESPQAPQAAAVAALGKKAAMAPLIATVAQSKGLTLDHLADGRFLDEAAVTRLSAYVGEQGFPLNTDANRYLEFATPRHNLEKAPHQTIVLRELLRFLEPADRQRLAARFALR